MASNGSSNGGDRKRRQGNDWLDDDLTNKISKHMREQSPSLEFTKGGSEFGRLGGGGGKLMDFDSSNRDQALKVNVQDSSREYVLKLAIVKTDNVTAEHIQTAGVLLSQAALLRELGEKLRSKIRSRI